MKTLLKSIVLSLLLIPTLSTARQSTTWLNYRFSQIVQDACGLSDFADTFVQYNGKALLLPNEPDEVNGKIVPIEEFDPVIRIQNNTGSAVYHGEGTTLQLQVFIRTPSLIQLMLNFKDDISGEVCRATLDYTASI